MKKVYLVTRQWFFKEKGRDYAMPMDKDTIEVYTSKAKAKKVLETELKVAQEDDDTLNITHLGNGFAEQIKGNLRRVITVTEHYLN